MAISKKDVSISLKIPSKTKRLIEEEADKDTRNFNDELLVLVTEALHARQYNAKNYM